MMLTQDYKQQVADCFGQAAQAYASQAQLQKDCAAILIDLLQDWQPKLPEGELLEIGCGTGFVTEKLIYCFPSRSIQVTDLSKEMLEFCRSRLEIPIAQKALIQFQQSDGEAISPPAMPYALIVSGFVIQWFRHPTQSLLHLLKQLQPGGILLISLPTAQSFPEWQKICEDLNLPFTANPLPDPATITNALAPMTQAHQTIEKMLPLQFSSAAEFLRSFKAIGAQASQTGKQLSVQQMRRLIQAWDARSAGEVTVHCHAYFGVFQR